MPRRALRTLCLVGLTVLGGLLLAFENRASLLTSATVADLRPDGRRRARDAHRAALLVEDEARRTKEIAQQAKSEVTQAIALHRSGEEGKDIVMTVTKSDDPVRQIAIEVLKNAGVSEKLVEESLTDWTNGVNVLEIGRRLQEKGIDIPTLVRQAEEQGLPVRQMLQEKDMMR